MRRFLPTLLVFLALAGCGSDSTSPSKSGLSGTWTLQTVNGGPLPFLVQTQGTDKEELTADSYTIANDGSFTQLTTERFTIAGVASTDSVPDAGQYTLNGTAVSITYASDGSTATGTWDGSNTLTITATGFAGVYHRQ